MEYSGALNAGHFRRANLNAQELHSKSIYFRNATSGTTNEMFALAKRSRSVASASTIQSSIRVDVLVEAEPEE